MTVNKKKIFRHPADGYTILGIVAYALYFSIFTVSRHNAYQTQSYDLSFYVQSLWNTLHGSFLRVTVQPGLENFLQVHFSPSLLLLVPLYAIWQSPEWLLIMQSIILATGAWPIYRLAGGEFNRTWVGLIFAIVYLLSPTMQAANLYDFHEITVAAPFLLWAWYFVKRKKWLLFSIFGVLALGFREEAVLIALGMGVLLILNSNTRRVGWMTLSAALLWLIILIFVSFVNSATSQNASMHFANRFSLGETPLEAIKTIWNNPKILADRLLSAPKILYYLNLYAPVGYVSWFSITNLILVVPSVILNALGTYGLLFSAAQAQYNALIAPFIVVSAAEGANWIISYLVRKTRFKRPILQNILLTFVLLLSIGYQLRLAHLPISLYFKWPLVTERHLLADEIVLLIPPDASLSALDNLAPHASQRFDLFVFPTINNAEYVFLDVDLIREWKADGVLDFTRQLKEIKADPSFETVYDKDGFLLLRRKN